MTKLEIIEKKIRNLPSKHLQSLERFIDLIYPKKQINSRKGKRHLKQDWAGALKKDKTKYTSVQLQHKIREEWKNID